MKMLTLLSIMVLVVLSACKTEYNTYQTEQPATEDQPQSEIMLQAKFTRTLMLHDNWGRPIAQTKKFYFVIEVDRDTFDKYQPTELIPSEAIVCLPTLSAAPFTNFTVTLDTHQQRPEN